MLKMFSNRYLKTKGHQDRPDLDLEEAYVQK